MRELPCLLVVLFCTASAAIAGPNGGGVLLVHDTGLVYSTDTPGPPYESPGPADCSAIDNEAPLGSSTDPRIWKVYAAFPAESSPRLQGLSWGIGVKPFGGGYVSITTAGLPYAEDFEVTMDGPGGAWPVADSSSVGESFPISGTKTSLMTEVYWFAGYAYGGPSGTDPQSFATQGHRVQASMFVDDANPRNADPIAGFGTLGFGQPGTSPCPVPPPGVGACCVVPTVHGRGDCTLKTPAACSEAGGTYQGDSAPCTPTACDGACCFAYTECQVASRPDCSAAGGAWGGFSTPCTPTPCPPPLWGACCTATGACTVTSEGECVTPDVWHPAWPICGPSPCLAPGDGRVVAWGDTAMGQCDVPQPNSGFVAVSGGGYHSLGLKSDGTIVVWGDTGGDVGNVPWPNAGFVAVSGGGNHSLGLKSDGRIVAWGDNGSGQCNLLSPNAGFAAVAGGGHHSLGLRADGSIAAWGANWGGQCNVPAPNAGFVAVSGGGYHSLGLKSDGTIVAWGANWEGQCDVPSPNAGFVAIASGWEYSLGLKSDGRIVAWGDNYYGQLDLPTPNADFVAIAAGSDHDLGLKSDGSIVAWGVNVFGQCNVPSPNAGFVAVAAGGLHSLGLTSNRMTPGACCASTGACSLALQAACPAPSAWHGAESTCTPNPCPLPPTPVLLESWAASSLAEGLQIRWEMPLGTTGAQYRAWRDPAAGPRDVAPTSEAVLLSTAWINASSDGIIETMDPGAPRGAAIRYFLEMSASGARSEFIGPVEARWDPPALAWSVGPTPFRGSVRLTPPGPGPARADIFDPAGRLVRMLARAAGNAPLEWDGRNDTGREVPTGIYLVRLTAASGNAVKRLVKIE